MTSKPATPHPIRLSRVLAEEFVGLHGPLPDGLFPQGPEAPYDDALEHCRLRALYGHIHSSATQRAALCFSGGGIRSATFNLGVIQALSRMGLLSKFDYLSTVSGGGYLGGWLTAWIHRLKMTQGVGIGHVEEALAPSTDSGLPHAWKEPPPLAWLRDYSNYLTPKLGFFSADSWTMIGIYLRNLLLNWLVLIPLLLAMLLLPRLYVAILQPSVQPQHIVAPSVLLWSGLGLAFLGLIYLHLFRPSLRTERSRSWCSWIHPKELEKRRWDAEGQGWFLFLNVLPLAFSAWCLTTAWVWFTSTEGDPGSVTLGNMSFRQTFALTAAGVHLASSLIASLLLCRFRLIESLVITVAGGIGGMALATVLANLPSLQDIGMMGEDRAEWYAVFGVSGFLSLFLLTATVFVGLAGRYTGDQDHEWWGRTGSWMLNISTVLGTLAGLVVFGPDVAAWAGTWSVTAIGGLSGFLALAGGFSAKTLLQESKVVDRTARARVWLVKAATPLFILLLLVFLSFGTDWLIREWSIFEGVTINDTWKACTSQKIPSGLCLHHQALHHATFSNLARLWIVLFTVGMVMGWFINVNKFSLHGFYRNRLIRAYLGASRGEERTPNLLTGFDQNDNVEMYRLAFPEHERNSVPPQLQPGCLPRPFHVVNIALNLVHGDKLAWQQRKAQSFTVSPLHAGSWQELGYRSSYDYGFSTRDRRAISLGTAIAISGAAASPNMGYHSSASVAFLLALFNVRLGWWLGNPGEAGNQTLLSKRIGFMDQLRGWIEGVVKLRPPYNRACPGFSVGPLLTELFALTNARSRYVYLSDGGHFENLGLYEMVLRRCHTIVVIDVGCDPDLSFQDLGNAIRKIRIDQGVEIEIDTDMITLQSGSQYSRWHHAIGSIRYDRVDRNAPEGVLVYLKPSLTGEEPSDVQDYATHHKAFPHESTSDQFFDESQFESYRHLGEHITTEVFRCGLLNGSTPLKDKPLDDVIGKLQRHWVPVPPGVQDSFLRETHALLDLEKQLRTDPGLARYDVEIYPEILSVFGVDPQTVDRLDVRSSLHLCSSQIQLMENVFLGVRLGEHYAHPLNRGWMNLFRRWTGAQTFRQWWPILRGTFSPAFVEFSERHLYLPMHSQFVYQRRPLSPGEVQTFLPQISREWEADGTLPQQFSTALKEPVQLSLSTGQHGPAVWVARITATQSPGVVPPLEEGELIGVVCLTKLDQHQWQIHGWIKPGYRDVGIGYQLFQQALDEATQSLVDGPVGTMTVIADLGPDDAPASGAHHQRAEWVRFYERLKFRRMPHEKKPHEVSRLRLSRTLLPEHEKKPA